MGQCGQLRAWGTVGSHEASEDRQTGTPKSQNGSVVGNSTTTTGAMGAQHSGCCGAQGMMQKNDAVT